MQVTPITTRVFLEREPLFDFILEHIDKVPENSVLVVTSKIAALTEGRVVLALRKEDKDALIQSESE
ncbi:hypothetical protein EBR66_03945 [bacterium]|nr:hypothetical protein [bacterium]